MIWVRFNFSFGPIFHWKWTNFWSSYLNLLEKKLSLKDTKSILSFFLKDTIFISKFRPNSPRFRLVLLRISKLFHTFVPIRQFQLRVSWSFSNFVRILIFLLRITLSFSNFIDFINNSIQIKLFRICQNDCDILRGLFSRLENNFLESFSKRCLYQSHQPIRINRSRINSQWEI